MIRPWLANSVINMHHSKPSPCRHVSAYICKTRQSVRP
jgi:hypothetical protein